MLLKVKDTMEQMIDFSSGIIDHDMLDRIIIRIIHIDDYEYAVYLNLRLELDFNSGQ